MSFLLTLYLIFGMIGVAYLISNFIEHNESITVAEVLLSLQMLLFWSIIAYTLYREYKNSKRK